MYQQIQSYPTPFLFLKTPPRNYIEASQAVLSLDSLVLALPLTRVISEDFPPNAALSLESVNVVLPPGPVNRSVTEDFPPTAALQVVSVVVILPVTRSVTEDFPPTGTLSLESALVFTAVTEVLPAETANAAISLQSLVV